MAGNSPDSAILAQACKGLRADQGDLVTVYLPLSIEARVEAAVLMAPADNLLDPANGAYDPQIYRPDEVQVQGKLAGLLRRYH